MRTKVFAISLSLFIPLIAGAQDAGVYRYVDAEGNVHYTDTPPPDASEYPKEVKNPEGVTVATIEGKKTEEELRAEKEAEEIRMRQELQLRADRARQTGCRHGKFPPEKRCPKSPMPGHLPRTAPG